MTMAPLIAKAFRETVAVSVAAAIPNEASIKTLIAKADAQMLSVASASGYQSDSVSARAGAAAAAAPVAAAAAPVAEEVKEDEPEEVSEEDAAAGLSALFG